MIVISIQSTSIKTLSTVLTNSLDIELTEHVLLERRLTG